MSNALGKTLAVALIALAGLTALAPAASAGYRDGYYGHGSDRHWNDRHDRWNDRRGRCAPWVAVDKARSHGIRGARVADVSRHRVVVEGWKHHRYTRIAFANAHRCPTLWS